MERKTFNREHKRFLEQKHQTIVHINKMKWELTEYKKLSEKDLRAKLIEEDCFLANRTKEEVIQFYEELIEELTNKRNNWLNNFSNIDYYFFSRKESSLDVNILKELENWIYIEECNYCEKTFYNYKKEFYAEIPHFSLRLSNEWNVRNHIFKDQYSISAKTNYLVEKNKFYLGYFDGGLKKYIIVKEIKND